MCFEIDAVPDNAPGLPSDPDAEAAHVEDQPGLLSTDNASPIPYVMVLNKPCTGEFFKIEKDDPNIKTEMVVANASHLRRTLPRLSALADKCEPKKNKEYIEILMPSEEEAQTVFSITQDTFGDNFIDAFRVLPDDVKEMNRMYLYFKRIRELEQLFTCIDDEVNVISVELDKLFPIGSHLANVDEMLILRQKLQEDQSFLENRLKLLFQRIRFQRHAK